MSTYNTTASLALNEEQLMRFAPSIFTKGGSDRVSEKYAHISTLDVIRGLQGEGFMPIKAMQCRTRLHHKRAFTKHMLRFRHLDAVANDAGLFPELVLVNSHDGLSSYRLMAGIYRMVCSNGLIAGDTFREVRVRHQGNIIQNVIEGTYEVMNESVRLIESADNMSGIILDSNEKKIFAEAVHQLRFDGQTENEAGIKPEQFLKARRYQENGKDDLFTVFNVAQENTIKGGLSGYAVCEDGRYRHRATGERMKKVTTREIKSIDQSNTLNRALWTLAEKMAALKAA
jgi:hypothetical protein